MKVITLEVEMSFNDALKYLVEGKCLGIRPGINTNYMVLSKDSCMNPDSPDYILIWRGSRNDSKIRTNQFLEMWYPVIVDHRDITY